MKHLPNEKRFRERNSCGCAQKIIGGNNSRFPTAEDIEPVIPADAKVIAALSGLMMGGLTNGHAIWVLSSQGLHLVSHSWAFGVKVGVSQDFLPFNLISSIVVKKKWV
jgi:hypothetical protein